MTTKRTEGVLNNAGKLHKKIVCAEMGRINIKSTAQMDIGIALSWEPYGGKTRA